MEYEWQTYGYAWISLPDSGSVGVHFRGTDEEAQRQVNEAAEKFGGVAPDLKANNAPTLTANEIEKIACRIFNNAF